MTFIAVVDEKLKTRKIKRLDDYINADTKIKWKCMVDEHEWYAKPTDVLNYNNGCPKCAHKHILSNKEIDIELENTNIKRIGDYNQKTKITKFQCKLNENHTFNKNARDVLLKPLCPLCKNKSELFIKQFIEENVNFDLFTHQYMIKAPYIKNYYLIDFMIFINGKIYFIEYNKPHHYRPTRYNSESHEVANNNFKNQLIRDENVRRYCKK